ncbi:MAG: hypothetical protein ACFFG0_07665 [Candidatus Thorarchaeota archaeon]
MSSYKLKILLVAGQGTVAGRTSFVSRFIEKEFQANRNLALGVDIYVKDIELPSGNWLHLVYGILVIMNSVYLFFP